ncbi:acyl-ACP thioesterase [Paenibacillus sp. DS2015]|uniref:acyl-[acyl-carrier-protein] thioesterase n=1 Tax=Paenibacillus sp. DS2015 TaxID=3373917 RepID=UPI003D1FFDFB
MGNTWTEEHLIYSNEIDYNANCRLSNLLSLMQRAADGDVEHMGGTRDQMLAHHLGWMLTTIDLVCERMPRFNETIQIRTWNKGTKGPLWLRDFRIYDENDLEIAKACTLWALVDIHKRKVLRPSAYPFNINSNHDDSVGPVPDKMNISDEVELYTSYSITVRYSGIDSNRHLNNSRYADLCMDALTPPELDTIAILGFHITYVHEVKSGEHIEVLRSDLLNGYIYFRGQSLEGTRYFEACLHVG